MFNQRAKNISLACFGLPTASSHFRNLMGVARGTGGLRAMKVWIARPSGATEGPT